MSKKFKDFLIGTDLEFFMVNTKTGRIVKAGDYFGEKDFVGADANGRNFEVRSEPSSNPLDVTNSIKEYFQKFVNTNPQFYDYKWVCGSFVKELPAGFHQHFSVKFNEKYLPYLDNYLGAISLLLEPRSEGLERRKYSKSPAGNEVSYGKMSDIRKKPYGFEYRPVSSCVSSPYVLTAILALGKAVMFEAINNPSFKPHEFIMPEDFTEMNTSKVRKAFPQLWRDIQSFILYPKYKKYIDLIKAIVDRGNITWIQGKGDFKQNWGIKNFSKFIQPKKPVYNYIEEMPKVKFEAVPAPPVAKNDELDFDEIWKDLAIV